MGAPSIDLTAGRTARTIRSSPGAPQRILDPTDPRYEEWLPDSGKFASDAPRIVDPTNPKCGKPAA